ncbi:hypothetical protein MNV49_002949 [Pseudohyphozyma bogoriensis]|nr:hypothetical protein MNV49_002949 [Pseudohyphozyma bogoriensis]
MAEQMKKKLWGGRFTEGTDPLMWEFNQCLSYDKKLYAVDVAGSKAYALALSKTSPPILTSHELSEIVRGLTQVQSEWENNTFEIKQDDEDIHTANERRLSEIIGSDIGGKLHTGRSRNDQVATDMRLWLIKEVAQDIEWLQGVIGILTVKAEEWIDHIAAGFTHLQRAQPIRFSHFLLAHAHSFAGDLDRLRNLVPRVSTLPLGSGALAGNPFCVDRELLRSELNMKNVGGNSMQSVADRDFVAEYLFVCSLLMVHISRFAEDLIVYSTSEFGWVVCGDAYSTGSSIMPQKKNPDALELLRGKSGRTMGQLSGFLATLKGLPATYNKDLQESQEPMFDAAETIGKSLRILTGVISTLKIFPEKMKQSLTPDMLATDLAEYLVRKGIPFRETHHISGSCIRLSEQTGVPLSALTLEQFKSICPTFDADVVDVFNFETSVERRDAAGGTSRRAVLAQIENLKRILETGLYATLVCLTGCLFGGDTGSIGSITVMDQFVEHFGELSEFMRGFVVSVILLPSAVTGLVAGKLMDKISRKYTISLGAVIFAVGSGISCGAPNLAVLIVARCIAGAGEGLFLSASTCYLCEIAPRHLRGRVMSCFQLFISGALALGYFTCYGTVKMQSSFAWRTTFAMSTVVALFCAICTPYLPYSPRWLMSKGRRAEAEEVLNLVTGPEDEAERKELLAVPPADDVGWSHIFEKGVRGRTLLGTFLNVFQMTTGIDFVLFYSPTLFVQAGLDAATSSFIASGVTGIVVFLGTAVGTLFVDRAGRRPMIIGGGIAMTAALLLMGALYASKGAETKGGKWVVILLIEVFAATFAGTWALLVRLYAR